MTRVHRNVLAAGLVLAVACARMTPAGAPIGLEGPRQGLAALTGTWAGSYRSQGNAGYGRISFELTEGADSARGYVEMDFSPALRLYGETADGGDLRRQPCTRLDISVVRVSADSLRGTLAPYWNPACDCRTRTVFEGRLQGSRIAGVFTTLLGSGDSVVAAGRWVAERQ